MRWMCWVSAAVWMGIVAGAAWAGNCGCGNAMARQPGYAALCGEACCSPMGYATAPGCCEYYKPCCTNAWAGYCEHRAKVDACWSRVGMPRARCRPCGQITNCEIVAEECSSANPAESSKPTPAAPLPEKSGQRPQTTTVRFK